MSSDTYIKLSTKDYPRYAGDIETDPAGAADYAEVAWIDPPQIDRAKQRVSRATPTLVDGAYVTNWVVSDIPAAELGKGIRDKRNKLLAATDWTQVADSPVDKSAWAAYRQGLRDISKQDTFPSSVVWPDTPGGVQVTVETANPFRPLRG